MGYDFDFMSPRFEKPVQFPVSIEDTPPELDPLPWAAFREWLLSAGGKINGGDNRVSVDYGGDETIYFSGSDQMISLDTHAHWERVLAAYRKVKSLDARVCIFDPQDGLIHDERSFCDFLKQNGVSTDT